MDKTTRFEVLVAILLGSGALGGAWASYQSSQWGGTATEDFGKAATTATRASTLYNEGITIANRDAALDIQAKQLVLSAETTKDPLRKELDLGVAKYLYTQQMTKDGYLALGLPAQFHTKKDDVADKLPEEDIVKTMDNQLGETYLATILKKGNDKFAEADKIFEEGDQVSSRSTLFGLDGMFFTITLFLGGLALVIKSHVRWVFVGAGYGSLAFGAIKLFTLPWYHVS